MRNYSSFLKSLLVLFIAAFGVLAHAQVDSKVGKTLFRNNCASCHNKDMKKKMTGPALGGVEERWADFSQEDLYAWIRNSQAMIASGHPRAVEVANEWNNVVMTAFPNLTDDEIGSLLLYINEQYTGTGNSAPTGGALNFVEEKEDTKTSPWMYGGLAALLAGLALILARVISNLNVIAEKKVNPDAIVDRKSVLDILTSKGLIGFVLFAFVLLGGYTTVNNAVSLGRQQGYAPEQPIKFSHETHAGLNKIDCQYCHDGARRSKHSVIPATNTCMNCHKAINFGSEYGTAEITKIYASAGFDPLNSSYIENYDKMSEAEIEAFYKDWIVKANTDYNEDLEGASDETFKAIADDQWKEVVSSLTNDQKTSVRGPIEWTRIHNLPDHVYFNHAQHVTVGEVECQTCHGAVEEMEVVQQMSPLSMGWCINCHRQTDVNFNENAYYSAYEDYHKELKAGDRKSVKVADIGGLECQKCHY